MTALNTTATTTTATTDDTPAGFWRDTQGRLVPEDKVRDIDKLRHQVVVDLCRMAREHAQGLRRVKRHAFDEVAALVATSMEQYGVAAGGEKGNVTLTSFDGRYKVVRHMQERIVFGEQLMAAKELIDQCVTTWSAGASDNIRALVQHAFQVDKEGKINTARVLSLRRLAIDDPAWLDAMSAIADSMHTTGTTAYIRFYERTDTQAPWRAIVLDMAGV